MAELDDGCTLAAFSVAKNLPLELLRDAGISETVYFGRPALRMPYHDRDGREVAVQRRLRLDKPAPPAPDDRFNWYTGSKVHFYGLERITPDVETLYLVEGVSDVLTAWLHDLPAIGLPGANSGKTCLARANGALDHVKKVVVLVEPDQGGDGVLKWLATRPFGDRAHVVFLEGAKDLSALHVADPVTFGVKFLALLDGAVSFDDAVGHPRVHAVVQQHAAAHPPKPVKATIATKLVALAQDPGVALCHTASGEAFAVLAADAHAETHLVRSKGFRAWLTGRYYAEHHGAPGSQALHDALGTIEAIAVHDGEACEVSVRVAAAGDRLYLDLGDDAWRVVEITASGWTVLEESPVRFRRPKGLVALPVPVAGGTLADLRPFMNISDDDWTLAVAFIIAAYLSTGPYPLLVVGGEQGSAKSTLARVYRKLVDPHATPLRSEPRDQRDLMIAAKHSWLLAFDNVRELPHWLSDALARLSTGGGFGTRTLYADDEETTFDAMRPVIVNGIAEIVVSPDLLDRAIQVTAPVIPNNKRREEQEFWTAFDAACPRILGALLDVLVGVLRVRPTVQLRDKPRMADFARTGVAVERVLGWKNDQFLKAYLANRAGAHEATVEASPVARYLRDLIGKESWSGTSTDLLAALTSYLPTDARDNPKFPHGWPKGPRALSSHLRHMAPALRGSGIGIEFITEKHRRLITLTGRSKKEGVGEFAFPAVPAGFANEFKGDGNANDQTGTANGSQGTANDRTPDGDGNANDPVEPQGNANANPENFNAGAGNNARNARNANSPPSSMQSEETGEPPAGNDDVRCIDCGAPAEAGLAGTQGEHWCNDCFDRRTGG